LSIVLPHITVVFNPPSVTDGVGTFNVKAIQSWSDLAEYVEQTNNLIDALNDLADDIMAEAAADVLDKHLSGLDTSSAAAITSSNTVIEAFGQLQAQVSGKAQAAPAPEVKTAAFTAVDSGDYACNTSSAAFTVTPPASPAAGARFQVRDYGRTFSANNLTVATSSAKVEGVAENYVIDQKDACRVFTYIDSTKGWMVSR